MAEEGSPQLERARRYFEDRRYDKAVNLLWEVRLNSDDDAEALRELAGGLRDLTEGRLRTDCEHQLRRAEAFLSTPSAVLEPEGAEQPEDVPSGSRIFWTALSGIFTMVLLPSPARPMSIIPLGSALRLALRRGSLSEKGMGGLGVTAVCIGILGLLMNVALFIGFVARVAQSENTVSAVSETESLETHYVDPTYGYSLDVDPRFAGHTAPGAVLDIGVYTKGWIAEGSSEWDDRPDNFVVAVMGLDPPMTMREIRDDIRACLADVDMLAADYGPDAEVEVSEVLVDGRPALAVDVSNGVDESGERLRTMEMRVYGSTCLYLVAGVSSPETWSENRRSFEAMIASFHLPWSEH